MQENNDWANEPIPENTFKDEQVYEAKPIEDKVGNVLGSALMNHKDVAKSIKDVILSGEVEPLELYIGLRRMDKVIKLTISSEDGDKELKSLFREKVALALDGGKSIDMYGANLSIRPTGTRYEFGDCKDSYLNELVKIEAKVKQLIKERQDFIKVVLPPDSRTLGVRSYKLIQQGMPSFEISEDEFEETIFPCTKMQGESIFCTFKDPKH